jgi:hypothetical protein
VIEALDFTYVLPWADSQTVLLRYLGIYNVSYEINQVVESSSKKVSSPNRSLEEEVGSDLTFIQFLRQSRIFPTNAVELLTPI